MSGAILYWLTPRIRHHHPKLFEPNLTETSGSLHRARLLPSFEEGVGFSDFRFLGFLISAAKAPFPVSQNDPRMIELQQFVVRKSGSPAFDSREVARDLAHKRLRAFMDSIKAVTNEIM